MLYLCEMNKTCTKCGLSKDTELFKMRDGKPESVCKECTNAYLSEYYRRNKQTYLNKQRLRKADWKEWYKEYKSTLRCIKCGESHPGCLDFHHRDPSTKEYSISVSGPSLGRDKLLIEIAKCDILCVNCHRKLHYEELNR